MAEVEVAGAASLGHQALEAHREREEARSRKVWLHAWHDPVAGLKAFSSCVRLADLNGDGDCKLLVAGMDRKLRVYKGTSLLSENILLDEPVRLRTSAASKAAALPHPRARLIHNLIRARAGSCTERALPCGAPPVSAARPTGSLLFSCP